VTRSNLLLLLLTIACALGVVTSQHKARKLFMALQKEKTQAQQMDVELGQLQLEQSTWAMPARVEKIAANKLHMHLPRSGQTRYVHVEQTESATEQP
jgi:cell division protein FtsL